MSTRLMTKIGSLILLTGVAVLLAPRVERVVPTNPPVTAPIEVSAAVDGVLRRACYDCHSHETVWPWYSEVIPFSWLIARDVREGRGKLNFSTWKTYDPARQRRKLKETGDEVAEGKMPPWYYVLVHPNARLDATDREILRTWTVSEISGLENAFNDRRPHVGRFSRVAKGRTRADSSPDGVPGDAARTIEYDRNAYSTAR